MQMGFLLNSCQEKDSCGRFSKHPVQLFQGLCHLLNGEVKHVYPIWAATQTLIKSGTYRKLNTRQESYNTNTNVVDYVALTNQDLQLFLNK